jgi:hypothetical protein
MEAGLLGLGALAMLVVLGAGCGSSGGGSKSSGAGGSTGGTTGTVTGTADISADVETPERPWKGTAVIRYELLDPASEAGTVTVDYSPDGGVTWLPATPDTQAPEHEGTTALSSSPLGARHAYAWDTNADLGAVNNIHVKVRVTPADASGVGAVAESDEVAVINLGRQDPDCDYDDSFGVLVLSADMSGGFVPYSFVLNHIVHMKIYGDGKAVYTKQADGDRIIYTGFVSEEEICALFELLAEKRFWSMQDFYRSPNAPTDMPSARISAKLRTGTEKSVGSYGGQMSAPPGYMDMYDALHAPQVKPQNEVYYIRATISQYELNNQQYIAAEHEKKWDTPLDWDWIPGGARGGQDVWRKR